MVELTEKQYKALCELFHEYNEAFKSLPEYILAAYYKRLYRKD